MIKLSKRKYFQHKMTPPLSIFIYIGNQFLFQEDITKPFRKKFTY